MHSQAVFLEPTAWSVGNGFLTSTEKKRRGLLQSYYKLIQEQLYSKMTLTPQQQISDSHDNTLVGVLSDLFLQILSQVCTLAHTQLSPSSTFAEIGGDSLSAARLANIFSTKHNIQLSMQALFEYPLGHLSQLLETQTSNSNNTNARHALRMQQLPKYKIDWAAEWTLPSDLLLSPSSATSSQNHILITGCTGGW